MPTIFTHAAVPLALGAVLGARRVPPRLLLAGVFASILPDADVFMFRLHVAYSSEFGHRGFSHSLLFALVIAGVACCCSALLRSGRVAAFTFVLAACASHGLLDMLTNAPLGVAWWWPLSDQRLLAPWAIIEASPLSLRRLLAGQAAPVLETELLWIWLPEVSLSLIAAALRISAIAHQNQTKNRLPPP